jgi:hypothetical protein
MKRKLIIPIFLFVTLICNSQERLGITNSNYSSTNAIQLNPSASVDSRTYMQLNLIGAHAYAKTNFGYLPNFSYQDILKTQDFKRSPPGEKKFLYAALGLEGPSYIISKRQFGAGFFTRLRNVTDMRHVTYEMASVLLEGGSFNMSSSTNIMGQKFKNAKFSSMTWMEYGINFGRMIKKEQDILVTFAGNLKYNSGISLTYANIREFDSYDDGKGSFGINQLDARVKRSEPGLNTGKGIGLDLGVTYKITHGYVDKYMANSIQSNCDYVDYKFKIGVALRDMGFVRFKKGTTDTRVVGSGHFDPYHSDTSFATAMQFNFSNTTDHNSILASLPTSAVGQFDWNFDNNVYLNVTAVKNLVPTRITGVQGADLISICPRIEFRQVEFAIPLTLQKFIYPQLGFAFRYRSFVAGVDNVVPVFVTKNTDCLGAYVSLAVSIFRNPACNVKKGSVSDCPKKRKNKGRRKKLRYSMNFLGKRKIKMGFD